MQDVSAAIISFQLAVASGPPQAPRVLGERLTAGHGRAHGPGIPGPRTGEATLEAEGSSGPPLLPWRPELEMNGLGGKSGSSVLKAPLSMTKTKTLFSLKTSVHVHSWGSCLLSRSAPPCGRESPPGQGLLRLLHELV